MINCNDYEQVGVRQAMLIGGLCYGFGFGSMAAGVHYHSLGHGPTYYTKAKCRHLKIDP
jgi:hypothetical protein